MRCTTQDDASLPVEQDVQWFGSPFVSTSEDKFKQWLRGYIEIVIVSCSTTNLLPQWLMFYTTDTNEVRYVAWCGCTQRMFAYSNTQETKYFIFIVHTYHCGFQYLFCYLQPLLCVYQLIDGLASLSQKNLEHKQSGIHNYNGIGHSTLHILHTLVHYCMDE